MKTEQEVTIKAIIRKVSQSENVYHEITIEETLDKKNDEDEIVKRNWNKLYYPHEMDTNVKEDLIDKKVTVLINFYPVKRVVGDQEFTNINCHIEEIKELKSTE